MYLRHRIQDETAQVEQQNLMVLKRYQRVVLNQLQHTNFTDRRNVGYTMFCEGKRVRDAFQ